METEIVALSSQGDLATRQPLYALGITGVFTRTLDVALLEGRVDLAIHSLKDVPTQLPRGLEQIAVLPRAEAADVLVRNPARGPAAVLATGSLRRRAFWLSRFPTHQVVGLRGNVQTRLQKLAQSPWWGAVFAEAGLARMGLLGALDYERLDWMLPAPAQGAIAVHTLSRRADLAQWGALLNHEPTALCTGIERDFLAALQGGCSAPIGARAEIHGGVLFFEGALLSLDGREKVEVSKTFSHRAAASKAQFSSAAGLGAKMARELLEGGGAALREALSRG